MKTDEKTNTKESRTQPGTADIDAALERQKQYTRKLHNEVQQIKGNKAQHSPLPWHVNDMNPYEIRVGDGAKGRRITDCREAYCTCYTEQDIANAKLIVASVNHAQALAEALRITAGVLRHCNGQFEATKEIIADALQAYEEAKQ